MTNDKDDRPGGGNKLPPRFSKDLTGPGDRPDPLFGDLDENDEEDYEEPERDTDYPGGYGSDDFEDEEDLDDDEDIEDSLSPDDEESEELLQERARSLSALSSFGTKHAPFDTEEDEAWTDEEEYFEEDVRDTSWPLRLLIVGAVALGLLGFGAYGVIQERAATQKELRELRATLATSANPEDVSASRQALRKLEQSYETLAAEAEALARENRRLTDTIARLEGQPDSPSTEKAATTAPSTANAEENVAPTEPAESPATASPTTPPKAIPPQSSGVEPAGRWFVNFGSYSSRTTAESWASKLQPASGEVIVVPGTKDDRTYYRVRVVGLADKASADTVARKLEAELAVSRLWVGQD